MDRLLIGSIVCALLLPSAAMSWDEEVSAMADLPPVMEVSERFAAQTGAFEYGTCGNAAVRAATLWSNGANLPIEAQFQWAIISNALIIVERDFLARYGSTAQIDDAFENLGGAYFEANMDSIVERCLQILETSFEGFEGFE